jgi:hypothetical protein
MQALTPTTRTLGIEAEQLYINDEAHERESQR